MLYTGSNGRCGRLGAQVRGLGACARRTHAAVGRGCRSRSPGLWRCHGRGSGQRLVRRNGDPRNGRIEDGAAADARTASPSKRSGPKANCGSGRDSEARPGVSGGTGEARGSGVSAPLDLPERASVGRPTEPKGHTTSHRMVAEILHRRDYSLRAKRKTLEGSAPPDREAQFHRSSDKIREFQADRQPVISVDRKKKELVGDLKNNGRE